LPESKVVVEVDFHSLLTTVTPTLFHSSVDSATCGLLLSAAHFLLAADQKALVLLLFATHHLPQSAAALAIQSLEALLVTLLEAGQPFSYLLVLTTSPKMAFPSFLAF